MPTTSASVISPHPQPTCWASCSEPQLIQASLQRPPVPDLAPSLSSALLRVRQRYTRDRVSLDEGSGGEGVTRNGSVFLLI